MTDSAARKGTEIMEIIQLTADDFGGKGVRVSDYVYESAPAWEYHDEEWDGYTTWPQAIQRLTNLGEHGWELVAVVAPPSAAVANGDSDGSRRAIFKRMVGPFPYDGEARGAWPPMAHVSAAAATGHPDYCLCDECEAHRARYVRADAAATELSVLDRELGLTDD